MEARRKGWRKKKVEQINEFLSITNISCKFVTFSEDPGVDDPVGEVSVQVDLFTHPGTGEHKVTVKGMLCDNTLNVNNLPFLLATMFFVMFLINFHYFVVL